VEESTEPGSSDDKANQETQDAGKPFNIRPVSTFSAEIQFSLQPKDEATIPWQGQLQFRMCNLMKIKYEVLVRMVCQVVSDCIC